MQGAGGTGGLIATVCDSSAYQYFYDATGNVTQLINTDGPDVQTADDNPFRFSTKYFDVETGLYYYGYRYYSPELGRWLRRDPLEEKDSSNMYKFVWNDPINGFDFLGQYTLKDALNEICYEHCSPALGDRGYKLCMKNCRRNTSEKEIFTEWLRLERAVGQWWKNLPKCPKKICVKENDEAENPDSNVWSDSNLGPIDSIVISVFHPGAEFEIRTLGGVKGVPQGNQCTYDSQGDIITSIPAAGSADYYGPNNPGCFGKHQDHDVATYKLAKRVNRIPDYFSVRPIWK